MIPHEEIEAFVQVFAGSPRLAEIELKSEGEVTLRLRRSLTEAEQPARKSKPATPVASTPKPNSTPPTAESVDTGSTPTGTVVTSTLVGVFRAATREPVGLDSTIKAGQVLGFIEVMRLSNEVTAPVAGTIIAIRVQDGQPVEYGQPLFEIAPIAETIEE